MDSLIDAQQIFRVGGCYDQGRIMCYSKALAHPGSVSPVPGIVVKREQGTYNLQRLEKIIKEFTGKVRMIEP